MRKIDLPPRIIASPLLDMLYEFRIEEGESEKLSLVEVHHEQLVRWREVRFFAGELTVEVTHVLSMFLEQKKKKVYI